jgi:serine/threonine protein kinase
MSETLRESAVRIRRFMEAGAQFGNYRLISRIGSGGMGEVWKAEDPRLRRTVAIKILPAESTGSEESNARFVREARTAAQLYHPNIATVHSIEEHDGRLFIVMEYVEGEPLSRAIRSGRLGEAEVAFIGKGVAAALAEAHAGGIVHRDIKPDNVILSGPRVKVLDFGIAKKYQTEEEASDEGGTFTDFRTQRGVILGTVQYMSPEQAMGKPLDGRSDIFSLGVMLYEASTGRLPFRGETVTDTLTRIIRDDPPDLRTSHPNLSRALADTIMKCLAKNRDLRFRDAREVASALDEVLAESRTGRRTTEDLPTAVSVSHDEVSMSRAKPVAETSEASAVAQRRHGPWPWIFATLLLVVLSVAGTVWYLTNVLRPAGTASAGVASPAAGSEPVVPDDVPDRPPGVPDAVTQESPPAAQAVNSGIEGRQVEEGTPPAEPPLDPLDGPGARPIPPEAAADATSSEKAEALTRRGFWLIGHGREGEGVEALRRATEIDPSKARAWLPIGIVALRRARAEDASNAFAAALRNAESLGPRDVELAMFGKAVADGDLAAMNEYCRSMPFDRDVAELRRLAHAAGAECGAPGPGPGRRRPGPPAGGPPKPNP